jgi:predicted RNase H-like HicB family nuclease
MGLFHPRARIIDAFCYVATVPALPGCVSQGDTREEVMRNIREAADLYIEDCIAADEVPTEVGRDYIPSTASAPA